jgi:predicted glycoside hydrolase/deacetylase ChbG (UPF0249 family)
MGAAYEFNRPGQQLLSEGSIQSASVLVPCQWFDEFANWCRANPGHDVGVSLTFNSANGLYRWCPTSSRSEVPSLLDPDGFFWPSVLQFAFHADSKEVEREVRMQILRARSAGFRPSHLMTHMGSLLTRPDLMEIYLKAAEKYWLPAVMVELTPANIEQLREEGFELTQEMVELVARYRLPKLDDVRFVPDTESYEAKCEAFFELIRNLEPCLVQIHLHPADKTQALELLSPRWKNRVWEAQLLSDPAVKEFLEDEEVVLTDWIEIMQRFQGRGNAPSAAKGLTD